MFTMLLNKGRPMLYDPTQGQGQSQGHAALKCAKMDDYKVYFLRRCACNQKDSVNYDTP